MKAWIVAIALVLWATLPGARSLPREKWSDTAQVKWSALNRSSINTEQAVIQTAGIFKGCYSDTEGHILGKTGWMSESDSNFNADCKESCMKKGYAVASTQGRYCYCTNSLPLPLLYHPNNEYAAGNEGPCSLTCPGAFTKENCVRDECCGGENAYTVYTVGQWPDTDQLHMKADEEGYTMIQNLQDTKLPQDIEYSEGETQNNEPLASIQSIGTFDGCYSDEKASILGTTGIVLEFILNFNILCQQNCKESGYAIASTKGSKCYCTSTLPLPQLHSSDDKRSAGILGPCNVACPGSYASYTSTNCEGHECCGGIGSAYSVYIVGEIDSLKQLQRRIINRIMTNPQYLPVLIGGNDFSTSLVIGIETSQVIYYKDNPGMCKGIYSIGPTVTGDSPRSLTYDLSTLSDRQSIYVFRIIGDMDAQCTFQRMKVQFFAHFSVVTTSDSKIKVVLLIHGNQVPFQKNFFLKDVKRERGSSGYYYTVDIQLPISTRASRIMFEFYSKYVPHQGTCNGAYPQLAYIDVWGTGCTPKLPERYGVSVIARGRTATNKGIGADVTYKLTNINQAEDRKIVSSSKAERLDMLLLSMDKLVERDEFNKPEIFLNSDVVCNHIYSGGGTCERTFSESADFQETFSIQHGVDFGLTIGVETEVGALFAKVSNTFEFSFGYSFTTGTSETKTSSTTETFSISVNTPAGYKTDITFLKSFNPVHVKWRAVIVADGYVLVNIVNPYTRKEVLDKSVRLHLTQLLSSKERELYAFGRYDYGERQTISAMATTKDKYGQIYSQGPVQPDPPSG